MLKKLVYLALLVLVGLGFLLHAYEGQSHGVISLPKTGQTKCYGFFGFVTNCSGTGQDGEFKMGMDWPNPRFTLSGDCVTDNLTGLMWPRNGNLPNGTKTWEGALDYVASMNSGSGLCGYKDWRLPNVNELESLVNSDVANNSTWLNGNGFNNVQPRIYWSSTTRAHNPSLAWVVNMWDGEVGLGFMKDIKSKSGYVWPVRSVQSGSSSLSKIWKTGQTKCYNTIGTVISCSGTGQDGDLQKGVAWPTPRFTDHSNGTVTDNLTGLMWTKDTNPIPEKTTWSRSIDYVKTVNIGGYSDWRLPNKKELFSLIDHSKYHPALPGNHPFQNVQSNPYWSSTTSAYSTRYAWVVYMEDSMMNYRDKGEVYNKFSVWPVRLGK